MIADAFFAVLLAIIIVIGLVCIPVASFLLGLVWGQNVKGEVNRLIDRIDGKQN